MNLCRGRLSHGRLVRIVQNRTKQQARRTNPKQVERRSTPYEWTKLILSQDFEQNPFHIVWLINKVALRGGEAVHILQLSNCHLYSQKWQRHPNVRNFAALAMYKTKQTSAQLRLASMDLPLGSLLAYFPSWIVQSQHGGDSCTLNGKALNAKSMFAGAMIYGTPVISCQSPGTRRHDRIAPTYCDGVEA